MTAFGNCPTCDKRITDYDPDGCETPSGQRFCLVHLTREADPELYDAFERSVRARVVESPSRGDQTPGMVRVRRGLFH